MQAANSQISKARWWRWALVAAWMSVIFIFSTQPQNVLDFGQTWLVSKLAHVTEYAILGGLIQWARGDKRVWWQAWLVALAYAAADEFHQSFVPGRNARVTDVMIDGVGALIGIALARRR